MAFIKKLTHTAPDGTVTVRRFLTNKGLSNAFVEEMKQSFERNPVGDGKVYIDGVLTHNLTSEGVITEIDPEDKEN